MGGSGPHLTEKKDVTVCKKRNATKPSDGEREKQTEEEKDTCSPIEVAEEYCPWKGGE